MECLEAARGEYRRLINPGQVERAEVLSPLHISQLAAGTGGTHP